jgi:hypothetical protein
LKQFLTTINQAPLQFLYLLKVIMSAWVQAQSTHSRPNSVFIFADDMRAGALGSHGNTYLKTPVLHSLAREGTLLTHTYILG